MLTASPESESSSPPFDLPLSLREICIKNLSLGSQTLRLEEFDVDGKKLRASSARRR